MGLVKCITCLTQTVPSDLHPQPTTISLWPTARIHRLITLTCAPVYTTESQRHSCRIFASVDFHSKDTAHMWPVTYRQIPSDTRTDVWGLVLRGPTAGNLPPHLERYAAVRYQVAALCHRPLGKYNIDTFFLLSEHRRTLSLPLDMTF